MVGMADIPPKTRNCSDRLKLLQAVSLNTLRVIFKKEFDSYRIKAEPHPLMTEYKVDAVPMKHDELERKLNSTK